MIITKEDHERAKDRSRRKAETDRISNLLTAEARGYAKGLAKSEAIAKKRVAINLLKRNTDLQFISEVTDLSLDSLATLKSEIEQL